MCKFSFFNHILLSLFEVSSTFYSIKIIFPNTLYTAKLTQNSKPKASWKSLERKINQKAELPCSNNRSLSDYVVWVLWPMSLSFTGHLVEK